MIYDVLFYKIDFRTLSGLSTALNGVEGVYVQNVNFGSITVIELALYITATCFIVFIVAKLIKNFIGG